MSGSANPSSADQRWIAKPFLWLVHPPSAPEVRVLQAARRNAPVFLNIVSAKLALVDDIRPSIPCPRIYV